MLQPLQSQLLAKLLAQPLVEQRSIRHGFFTRQGGVSKGVYASLNCGLGSGDERALVEENRDRVGRHLGATGAQLLTCYQIHSATAVIVDRPWAPDAQPKADALVTRTRGLVLGTLAADCAPILFADSEAGVIAAAHAGWKGALGGIVEATVVAMEQVGARRGAIRAALGPCIGHGAYEVGPEFEAMFLAKDAGNSRFFLQKSPAGRAHFDLPGFVLSRLLAAGVGEFESATQCTYANPEQFFSFRRMTHQRDADYGRQISAISLAEAVA
jgi:polyphenol oxidase